MRFRLGCQPEFLSGKVFGAVFIAAAMELAVDAVTFI